jgi:hypothetical protein
MNDFLIQYPYVEDIDTILNSFNTYLRIFYSDSPPPTVKNKTKYNPWMTNGIKLPCQHKTESYLTLRNSNDPNLKLYYITYSKMSSKIIIRATKHLHYRKLISNSNNKMKSAWNVVKSVTSGKINKAHIQFLNIDGQLTDNYHIIRSSNIL